MKMTMHTTIFALLGWLLVSFCATATGDADSSLDSAAHDRALQTGMNTTVLLLIEFDQFPEETRWEIADDATGNLVSQQSGVYSQVRSATEQIILKAGQSYTLTVLDTGNDGICCNFGAGQVYLFLGDTVDTTMTLVYGDGTFSSSVSYSFVVSADAVLPVDQVPPVRGITTRAPSVSVAPSVSMAPSGPPVEVLLMFDFDAWPEEVSWALLDANDMLVASGPPEPYTLQEEVVTVQLLLNSGEFYTLLVFDEFGDGICCTGLEDGAVYVFLGWAADTSRLLAFSNGIYDRVAELLFTVSPDSLLPPDALPWVLATSTPSSTPSESSSPTITGAPTQTGQFVFVLIRLDNYPAETAWQIRDGKGNFSVTFPFGTYDGVTSPVVNATVFLEDGGGEYFFTIADFYRDGIFGKGEIFIFLGTQADPNRVLVYLDGFFSIETTAAFVPSEANFLPPIFDLPLSNETFTPTITPMDTSPAAVGPTAVGPTTGAGPLVPTVSVAPSSSITPSISQVPVGVSVPTTSSTPSTTAPITAAPVTKAPVTSATTGAPVTAAPITAAPITAAPVTTDTTGAPVTTAPVATGAPVNTATTPAPTVAATPAPTPAPTASGVPRVSTGLATLVVLVTGTLVACI